MTAVPAGIGENPCNAPVSAGTGDVAMREIDGRFGEAEFLAHQGWLLALARRLALDESEAQDLAQDAWSVVARRGSGAIRDLRAYLGGIVRRRARRTRSDAVARRRREEDAARAEALPSAAELAERLELSRAVADELRGLGEEPRTLLLLCYQEGLAPAEIARRRGVPAATVRSQLLRAREALRERLDRRARGREAWAPLALALPGGPWELATSDLPAGALPAGAGAWIGGWSMSVAGKIGLGVLAVAGIVWLARGPRRASLEAPAATPERPALVERVAGEDAPGPRAPGGERTSVAPEPVAAAAADVPPPEGLVRLVDVRTGEPLPGYAVTLSDAETGAEEPAVADARGELRFPAERFARPFTLSALEDPELSTAWSQERTWSAEKPVPTDGAPWIVSFLVGPTYRLLLPASHPPLGELEVALQRGAEPALGPWVVGTVRAAPEGGLPWTRLDPEQASPARLGSGPWTLTVRDRAGLWLGWGAVRVVEGVQPEPVVIEAEPRGVLDVEVTVDGAVPRVRLGVGIWRLVEGEVERASERQVQLEPAARGHGRFAHLAPGRYRAWAGAQDLVAGRGEVDVVAGERVRLSLVATPAGELFPLEVVLQSETGRADLVMADVTARREGDPAPRRGRWVRDEKGARRLRFDGLPAGTWEVALEDVEGGREWDRTRAQADVGPGGTSTLEFTCLDAGAAYASRAVRVLDAMSGAALPFAGLTVYRGGISRFSSQADAEGRGTISRAPAGRPIGLLVCADEHRPRFLELVLEADGSADDELEVGLEPGWGTMLEVAQPAPEGSHGLPLADVRVRLDGVPVGATDADGRLLLAADAAPARIELERAGYRFDYGMLDDDGAPNASTLAPCWVLMRPDE